MENNINEVFNQKDKRISFLSILHSCAILHQGEKLDAPDLEAIAYGMTDKLFKTYPAPGEEIKPTQKPMQNYQPKPMSDLPIGKVKICPVPDCGHPMIRQYNKKNPKAPDWKCSDRNCKFSKAYDGGWKKSEFITGAWDESDTTKARQEDAMQDEANNQPPEEYGNHYDRQ